MSEADISVCIRSEVITNRVVHFEIPADNLERAKRF